MGDDERVAAPIVRPRCETFADAPDEVGIGLSAPRAGAGWIGAEGRQSLGIAGFDLHRAKSLPFAKPHLRQRGQHIVTSARVLAVMLTGLPRYADAELLTFDGRPLNSARIRAQEALQAIGPRPIVKGLA